ncbi:MAG: ribosome small subunit-dependent GTPase A [Porticoccaceae bacterium]|jgi:ribosome biogenesis GTPase / thiamine phosphate phosphatase|nr:ribosome small subunit-dependent GTPase A [Porticoccaceae bacterium]
MPDTISLTEMGWQPFFQQQISLDELDSATPARVVEHHKSKIEIYSEQGRQTLPITSSTPALTVGDWVLQKREDGRISRVLERQSCFRRKAAGRQAIEQLLAANVDTAFIVCSLNDDFNLNRIERYLSVVNDAGAEPVVVLTKMDLCAQADELREQVQQLDSQLCVEMVNGKDSDSTKALLPWCRSGQTVVALGSSGAGKSTLTNSLVGEQIQATAEIREDDEKGRHTTTHRSLLSIPGGAMIIDTPGMRELQLADCEAGVSTTFADIEELAIQCRFSDCQHQSEPGCAVQAALRAEELDQRRFDNYGKLLREQELNAASIAERRAAGKNLGKLYKSAKEAKYGKKV